MNDSQNTFFSEHMIRIIQSSHDAFIVSDSQMNIICSNPTAQKVFGYNEEEMTGLNIQMLMPEYRRSNYLFDMKSALDGKVITNIDKKIDLFGLRKNNEVFPIELTYVNYSEKGNNFFVSQIRDISEQKKSENELNTTTTALKIITEANKLVVVSKNEIEYLNSICEIITAIGHFPRAMILILKQVGNNDKLIQRVAYSGYTSVVPDSGYLLSKLSSESPTIIAIKEKKTDICADILGRGLWKYWVDEPDKIEFESTIATPILIDNEVEGVLRVFSSDPFYFSDERVELLEGLSKDIAQGIVFIRTNTAHTKALKDLEESENKYRSLFQSSNDAIFIADSDSGIIIDANEKAEKILGKNLIQILGMHYLKIHSEIPEDRFQALFDKHLREEKNTSEEFYLRTYNQNKATPFQVITNATFLNRKKAVQLIFRDISKSRMEEEKIRATQKMEALGTLSGGIAHDINNILSPIIGFTQLAVLEFENKEKQNGYLNEVLTAANRAKDLVSQILTFCRKSETDKKPHHIQSVLKEVIKLISVSLPKNVELQSVIDENCEPILCDPVQIYQIVINLCTNAYQAMKENGGILKVCLVRKGSSEIKSENFESIPFSNYICLIVSDTGCGMSNVVFKRIFEPYFTTKPKEEGTGLGLSVVSGIVKEHGAEIYVRTYPKEGTYFKISFPVLESALEKNSNKENISSEINTIKVLLVDDEPQITFMMKHMLEELGYNCEIFNDSISALDKFRSDPLGFDLVITDQTMPKLLGTELSRKVLEIRPEMPIILNTGYSPVASRSEAKKIGIKEFMMKPITISELSVTIERALKKI
jgi:PAS domain S-box-containing protein